MAKTRHFKLFGRDIMIGKRLFGIGKEEEQFGMVNMRGMDHKTHKHLESYQGIVSACIDLISETIGGHYRPRFERRRGDQWEGVNLHPFEKLLQNPSGNQDETRSMSQFELIEATSAFLELQGECYWYMALGESSGEPKEIVILRADKVGIDIDRETGKVNGYFVRRAAGDPIPLEPREVLHFRYFNPDDPYHGRGTVQKATGYIRGDELSTEFTTNFFNNNAGVSGILSINGEVSKNAFQKFVRQWRQKYEGIDSAGKVAIVRDTDATFEKVGLGLGDLDMTALRNMSKKDVLNMFRVPLPLLGEAEQTGLGRANVEALEYGFMKYNIEPKLMRFDAMLNFALKRYWPKDSDVRVIHEDVIPADKTFTLEQRKAYVDTIWTRNEIRDKDGLDAVPGGDDLRAPLTSYPINESTPTEPAAKKITLMRTRKIVTIKHPTQTHELEIERKENFRLSIMRVQEKFEGRYKKKADSLLEAQRKMVIAKLNPSPKSKGIGDVTFDVEEAAEEFARVLAPIDISLMEAVGPLALKFAGDDETDFKVTPHLDRIVRSSTLKMADHFNRETIEALTKTLAEGIEEGESVAKLAGRVNHVYGEAKGYRAERIARTETLKASNTAANAAYKQTGYVVSQVWYANPGACAFCEELDGTTVGLDETFASEGETIEGGDSTMTVDYENVDVPPLHPNCRCTIIPVS